MRRPGRRPQRIKDKLHLLTGGRFSLKVGSCAGALAPGPAGSVGACALIPFLKKDHLFAAACCNFIFPSAQDEEKTLISFQRAEEASFGLRKDAGAKVTKV